MDELGELLSEDPGINVVREKLRRLLERHQTGRRLPAILIQGETGTGKGLVARLAHRMGPRSGGPFVVINCPAIPETLFEAELFGFERGAFTDARRAKPGLFQAAHRGTLFLDEVGLLPKPLQAKLLTAIEERSVRRLGGTHPELVDACFISATNTDLQAAVRERRFREDLYHRLAVITLDLPALRDRGRDVLLLAERFLARACADYGLPPKRLDAQAQARLLAYSWPGNIRELANVIERAVLFTESPVVTGEMLDPLPVKGLYPPVPPARAVTVTPEEAMRQHLQSVLEQSEGNISHAAARLGVARNTLYARLAKFDVRGHLPPKAPLRRASRPATAPASAPTGARLQWERRSITLLRVALSAAEGFDAWPQTSRPLEDTIAKVHTFGGRVEDVTPTGLVAVFGLDPVEDAPRRAAHAAMAIQKSVQRARESYGGVLEVKIGLHVAPVFIGLVGARIEIDADAKHEPRRLLDQLLQSIGPGGTIASAAAAPFLERRFELVPMDAVDENSGPSYRLTGQERRGFGPWGATTRFVGRRDELEALCVRLASALSGRGQVVAVVGEPGVGKSRLFHEFTHSHRLDGWLVLESASVSYGQAMSYLPVVNLLKGYFQIGDRDTPRDIREKVAGKILALDRALEPTLPALFALLDVPVDDPGWQSLEPSRRRQQTLEAVKRLLLREAQLQPLLVVIEDLHWIDSETQALLDVLVESLPPARLLLLVSHRPGYEHRWGSRAPYDQVRLDPLSPESARELLDGLLGSHATVAPLKPILIQRTEGNPFFLEESVRDLAETGVLEGERAAYRLAGPLTEIEVPATVQAILAARIDRLPPEEKHLLQTAAVIGKDVPFQLLQAVADLPDDDLRRGLSHLQAAEFLYEKSLFPDIELTFKHALTQEVAYSGLLNERCKKLHARIVEAIRRLYPDRLTEQVEQLAHHAFKGELWEPAAQYLRQAGTKAAERCALQEADAWFGQALGALTHLPENSTTVEQAVDIRLGRGLVLTVLGDYRVVDANLSEAERLAEQLGDERRRGQVCRVKVNVHNHLGQMDEALAWGARALEIADRLGDLPLRRYTTTMLEQTHYMRGEYERAIELAQANLSALPVEAVYARPGGVVPTSVYDRGWLVRCLVELGRFAEAAEPAEAAIQIAERTQHPYAIGWACLCAGNLHSWKGNWAAALSLYERAIEVFREAGIVTTLPNVTAISSRALACLGDPRALARAQEGERLLEISRVQQRISGNSWSYVWLCHGYLRLGRLEDADRVVERVLEPRTAWSEACACHLRGEIAAHPDRWQPETAEGHYRRALALAQGCGMRPLVAHCHLGLGSLYRRTAQREQAREHLTIATTMYRDMDMRFWLAQAEPEMREAARGSA